MASPGPLTLEISSKSESNNQSAVASLSFQVFLSRVSGSLRQSLSERRPWTEVVERSAFCRPHSFSEASSRVRKNLSYFRVNYMSLVAVMVGVSLVWHPYSLVSLLSLLAAWLFLYTFRPSDQPLVLFGRAFSDRQTLAALVLLTVIVVFLTSVGSLIISTILVAFALLTAHAAFRVPEDLFLDDQDPLGSAFLSFVAGTNSASAPPSLV